MSMRTRSVRAVAVWLAALLWAAGAPAGEAPAKAGAPAPAPPPPSPAERPGLEALDLWRAAAWEDPCGVEQLAEAGRPGRKLLCLTIRPGGKKGKAGALLAKAIMPAEGAALQVTAYNPGPDPVRLGAGFFLLDDSYYECSGQELRPGAWQRLSFELGGTNFKTEATGWNYGARLPAREPFYQLCLLAAAEKPATLFLSGVELPAAAPPRLKAGEQTAMASGEAKSAFAGCVEESRDGELRLRSVPAAGGRPQELVVGARRYESKARQPTGRHPLDVAVLDQLMPGDLVEVGWYPAGKEAVAAWVRPVREFPRRGRVAGRFRGWDAAAGQLRVDLAAAPPGGEHMVGQPLVVCAQPPEDAPGEARTVVLAEEPRKGEAVEVEYEKAAESGRLLLRSLKRPGGPELLRVEAAKPKPPPPPPKKPDTPGDVEPD